MGSYRHVGVKEMLSEHRLKCISPQTLEEENGERLKVRFQETNRKSARCNKIND